METEFIGYCLYSKVGALSQIPGCATVSSLVTIVNVNSYQLQKLSRRLEKNNDNFLRLGGRIISNTKLRARVLLRG